jgi:RNase H-like domain found in reverse transcriptase
MDTNRDRHPCAYLSKSLTKEQRNYDTGDRELLAIVQALKEWRHYIQGSGHTTIVLSDHDNLRHFKVPQTIGQRMARWTLYLSESDIKLVHIPGKQNIQADSLSRRPDLCLQGIDNKDVIVLPEHLFVNLIDMELQKKIANANNMDYDAAEAIKELLEQGPREAKKDLMDWEVEEFKGENVLFYKKKTMCQLMRNSEGKLSEDTTIIQQQDIQENLKHSMRSRNIIGGQGFESLLRTTSKDVEHVNNSKLTEIHRNQCSCL